LVPTANAQTQPYKGQPLAIPGRIEAEDFDLGTNGVAYFDATAGQEAGVKVYRTDTNDVDVKAATNGGYALGWFIDGEWLTYTVNIATAGNYKLTVFGGAIDPNRKLRIELNGVNITGSVSMPIMTNWDAAYIPLTITPIALNAGVQKLRVFVETGFLDLDWVEFQPVAQATVIPTLPPTLLPTVVPPTATLPVATTIPTVVPPTATAIPSVLPSSTPLNTVVPVGAGIYAMMPAGGITVGQSAAVNIMLNRPDLMNGGAQALEASCAVEQTGAVVGVNVVSGSLFGPDPVIVNQGFQANGNILFAIAQSGQTALVNTSGTVFTINLIGSAPGKSGLSCTTKMIDGQNQELIVPFDPVQLTVNAQTIDATPTLPLPTLVPPTATLVPPTATLVPPTATLVPPTATLVPPTATLVPPTATLVPPTATLVPPTATLVPPTATLVPPTATLVPPTATLMPTSSASGILISGNVKRSNGQAQSISVSLLDSNGALVTQVFTQADGNFAFVDVKAGTYTIRAEAPACLSGQGKLTVANNQLVLLKPLVLPLGDIVPSQPSAIDELDLVQLVTNYNATVSTQNGTSILVGDLDQNGVVGLTDLSTLAKNLRMTDPVTWK
jgi:hypothetical protein